MYCSVCGKPTDNSVRFCPSCGAQCNPGAPAANSSYPVSRLVRPHYPRMIAGVCSAFALQYGWDLSLVRIVTVVLAIFTSGLGGLAYLAAWIIIPEAPYALPPGGAVPPPYGATAPPPYGSTGTPGSSTESPTV